MNYEQKYKQALERAKGMWEQGMMPERIEYIFSELNEDVNILVWLTRYIAEEAYSLSLDIRGTEDRIKLEKLQRSLDWLEKQAEKDPCIGCTNDKGCVTCENSNLKEIPTDNILAWLEKQGEQPTDKVEPKFKVGDWLQYRYAEPFLVEEITEQGYCNGNSCLPFEWEDEIHPWTIQDAKDGDVLSINWHEGDDSWEKIIIFKKFHNKGVKGLYSMPCVEGYGNTFKNGKIVFQEEIPYYSKTWSANLHPATKEQRYLLFQKMKEAGYKWYSEKKKLKKTVL